MKIKVQKIHPDAILPVYATDGSGCFDLHAIGPVQPTSDGLTVCYGKPVTVSTGLAFEIPEDHVMLVFSRSGHGFKHGTRLANCVGVIDSDFRGPVMVKLTADDEYIAHQQLRIRPGDRIAQAMVVPIPRVEFELTDKLSETVRGTGGLGSTGA